MLPVGPLMIEHRLIEKVIEIVRQTAANIEDGADINPVIIDTAVDFIRTYADRVHHGKEEDILFRELAGKDLKPDIQKIVDELNEEHVTARAAVRRLVEAKELCLAGDAGSREKLVAEMEKLAALYPPHIEKEDKVLFPAVKEYFSTAEMDAMLEEMKNFDRDIIHAKYWDVLKQLGGEMKRYRVYL